MGLNFGFCFKVNSKDGEKKNMLQHLIIKFLKITVHRRFFNTP